MTIELRIDGMECDHCVRGVKRALEGVPGVERAEVNLMTGSATVWGNAPLSNLLEAVYEIDEGYVARAE